MIFIRNFMDMYPTAAADKAPKIYDSIGIFTISAKDEVSMKTRSYSPAPKIAGIESKKENVTNSDLSIRLNIPKEIVAPLLEMLE
jgi:hypothetical protein